MKLIKHKSFSNHSITMTTIYIFKFILFCIVKISSHFTVNVLLCLVAMVFNIYEQSCSFIDVSSVKANPSLFYN